MVTKGLFLTNNTCIHNLYNEMNKADCHGNLRRFGPTRSVEASESSVELDIEILRFKTLAADESSCQVRCHAKVIIGS